MVKRSDPLPPVRLRAGDKIITTQEAAALRGISRETLRKMAEDGRGPQRVQLSERRWGFWLSDFVET